MKRDSNRSPRRSILLIILIFAILLGIFADPKSPLSPLHLCTLMGCRDSLEIILTTEPTQPYTVQVTSDIGDTRRITCTPGTVEAQPSATGSAMAVCYQGRVTFYDFSPHQVTVEISWEGGNFSMSDRPVYEASRPNGLLCPPVCKSARLPIDLP